MNLYLKNNEMILSGEVNELYKLKRHSKYKLKIRRFVEKSSEDIIIFTKDLHYDDMNDIVSTLKRIVETRQWKLNVEPFVYESMKENKTHIEYKYTVGNDIKKRRGNYQEKLDEFKNIVDGSMNRKLRNQQVWDAFFMNVMQKSGNFSVPGSGKTSSVYGMYAFLKNKKLVNKIVMIGPKNSFISWKDEFIECFGSERLNCLDIHSYKNSQERKRALLYESGNSNLILLNYESLDTLKSEVKTLVEPNTLLVFDEVHKIKNPKGLWASVSLDVAKNSKYLVALTGTPIPNNYTDIYNFLHLLYPHEYSKFFGFELSQLKEPDEDEQNLINQKIQPFYCRTTKYDLKVPAAHEDIIFKDNVSEIENKLFEIIFNKYRKNRLTLVIRLLQLESDPKMLLNKVDPSEFIDVLDVSNTNIDEVDYVDYSQDIINLVNNVERTTKMNKLIGLVNMLLSENKNIVIWCIFKRSMTNIEEYLNSLNIPVAIISGDVGEEQRIEIMEKFKNNEIKILITNPHTLAESVSLHKNCHDAIYFEYSYNLTHLLQSKDRIHRLGLPSNQYTQYYYLMSNFYYKEESYSLSEKIYERLMEKEQVMVKAIESNHLEILPTEEEDIEFLFSVLY